MTRSLQNHHSSPSNPSHPPPHTASACSPNDNSKPPSVPHQLSLSSSAPPFFRSAAPIQNLIRANILRTLSTDPNSIHPNMHFYREDLPQSPIDIFLTKLESASAEDLSPQQSNDLPTLQQLLEEEDVLRECRSENDRLIRYFCKPDIIESLVQYSVKPPSPSAPNEEPNGSTISQPPSDPPPATPNEEHNEKLRKFAYVSSEILSADIKPISTAIVENDDLMATVFSSLENTNRGQLNPLVPVYFSKVIISLLKMRNLDTIEQMSKRSPSFLNSILMHMDNGSIAELLVRILDGPEADRSYQVNKKPARQALDLLANNDILSGLAECFVRASSNSVDLGHNSPDCDTDPLYDNVPTDDIDGEEQTAIQRRLREETMANVTSTLLGLSERILQFPSLGCRIPDDLSPYSTPSVVSRLLDAGLYASCNGETKHDGLRASDYTASSEERVQAFTTGNNSALLHSLGLAADLMTTEANVVRSEEDDEAIAVIPGKGVVNRQMMFGMSRSVNSGQGIGASALVYDNGKDSQSDPKIDEEEAQILADFASRKSGDPIVSTNLLEAELSIRFRRLSEMFGDIEQNNDSMRSRPLGSLRLKLAEFFVACMKKSTEETVQLIIELKVPNKLLDLFRGYQWSSMLHGVVTNSIVSALEGDEVGRYARKAWFGAGLIPWLVDAWSRNVSEEENEAPRCRAGYMGHLIRIGTSLKAYIQECEMDPDADLPPASELESFAVFAERMLAPAHSLEATPLCGGAVAGSGLSDGDEGEEATDVLEMGGISFTEPLTDETSANKDMQLKYMPVQTEEEEEIKAVEVEDFQNFGKDELNIVKNVVDHDIPVALRERLEKSAVEPIQDMKPDEMSETVRLLDASMKYSEVIGEDGPSAEELSGVIDNIDSSSEDEGSYVAFVDDRKEPGGPSGLVSDLHNLKMTGAEPSNSLDGVVTEIEEPAPFSSDCLQSLATNIISVAEDTGNSSDEEYEAWEDPARVPSSASSEKSIRSKEDSQTSGVA